MGKVSQKTKGGAKLKKTSLKEELSSFTVEQSINAVQEKINVFDYQEANSCCKLSLEKFPENLELLQLLANTSLEIGDFEGARLSLEKSISIQPDKGHTKYFSLAQLLSDQAALLCYKKGVEIILKSISELKTSATTSILNGGTKSEESKPERTAEEALLYRQLSSGYCSIAELFTSELCDEDDAEKECNGNIQKAIDADVKNPEAYIQQANLRLIKEEIAEAKESILKSVSLWLPKYMAVVSGEAEAGSFDPVNVCPVAEELRIQTAKILMEVEEFNTAHDVLEGLLGEDDEDVQVWYLLGWNFYLKGDDFKVLSKQHLKKALQVHTRSPCLDEQLISHTNELLEEMKDVDDIDSEDDIDDYLDDEDDEEDAMETNE